MATNLSHLNPFHHDKKLYLDQLLDGVASAFVSSKASTDRSSADLREEYDQHDFLRQMPHFTFDISSAEVTLRFIVRNVEDDKNLGKRVEISTDFDKLSANPGTVSEVKFMLEQSTISRHKVGDDKYVLKKAG